MWCGNRDYLLRLRICHCVLGHSETVAFWHTEGGACSWTSSTSWLRHQNARQWRRYKRWNRDVSRKNASTTWKTISILCKLLSFFFLRSNFIHLIFLRFPLVLFIIHQFRNTLTNWLKPWLQRKHHLYVDICFLHNILWFKLSRHQIRFLLMHPNVPHYRNNWLKESNHQVWE